MDIGADGRPFKRARGGGGPVDPRRRGMFASMRFGKAQPWSTYGAMRVQRGTAENIARFGATARAANAEQKALRRALAYSGAGMYGRRMGGRGLYQGRGGFWGDVWGGIKDVGKKVGGFAVDQVAGRIPIVGGMVGSATKNALGLGAYATGEAAVTNDIVNGGQNQGIPTFSNAGPGVIQISHKEYLGDIYAPEGQGFQVTTYPINPGLARTFPWLSQVASNYEEYSLKQCILTFRSTVSDFNSGNGQVGTIIVATQYNPDDTPLATKQDMLEYDLSMSAKVSQNLLHGVECDPRQLSGASGKYVRDGPPHPGEDLKQYDHGVINVGVTNAPAEFENQSLGEIWISYTIELRKPRFNVTRGFNQLRDTWVAAAPLGVATNAGQGYVTLFSGAQGVSGVGQQDRIGGLWQDTQQIAGGGYPAGVTGNGLQYVFPAGFSGYCKVRFIVRCSADPSPDEVPTTVVQANIVPSGQFQYIRDMLEFPVQWGHRVQSEVVSLVATAVPPAAPVNNTLTIEEHLYVAPVNASSALDNILYFTLSGVAGGTPDWSTIRTYTVQADIEVYNSSFNTTSAGNATYGAKGLFSGPIVTVDLQNQVNQIALSPV